MHALLKPRTALNLDDFTTLISGCVVIICMLPFRVLMLIVLKEQLYEFEKCFTSIFVSEWHADIDLVKRNGKMRMPSRAQMYSDFINHNIIFYGGRQLDVGSFNRQVQIY